MTPELRFARACRYALFVLAVVSAVVMFALSVAIGADKLRRSLGADQ